MSKINSEPNCYSIGYAYTGSPIAKTHNSGKPCFFVEIGTDNGISLKHAQVLKTFEDVAALNNAMEFIRGLNLPAHKYSLMKDYK